MIADVCGYSRMMERDEEGTHARLREIRAHVTDPAIARRGGRIVRTAGDGMLVEFASAVEALSCAVEIQREMAARNRGLAADSRIDYRIGINLGDIIIDGSDIAGDGVNLAARLEQLAEPGGIALSRQVREAVRQVVGVTLNDAGLHRVKNLSEPVRVFTVQLDDERSRHGHGLRISLRIARPRIWGIATVLVVAALVATGFVLLRPTPEAPGQSVAVVPFRNLSGRQDGDALARRVTAEVTNALTRVSGLRVTAAATAAHIAASTPDPLAVGRRLNVRYVLDGTLTGVGERIRVAAHLVQVADSAQIWGDTIDVERSGDAGDVSLELIGRLSDVVRAQVRTAEVRRLDAAGIEDATALALRARARLPSTETIADVRDVRAMYERALKLDPKHVPALAGLAYTLAVEADRSFDTAERDALLARADELSLQAVTLDGNDADAWGTRSAVLQYLGRADAATEAIDRALALNPYFSELHGQRGGLLLNAGRAEEAIAALDRAIRLNPVADTVGVQLNLRCRALLYVGDYRGAIESCERATTSAPDWPDYMLLAAAYAQAGDMGRARQALAAMRRLEPRVTIRWLRENSSQLAPRALEQREKQLFAGLRKAGVPE